MLHIKPKKMVDVLPVFGLVARGIRAFQRLAEAIILIDRQTNTFVDPNY